MRQLDVAATCSRNAVGAGEAEPYQTSDLVVQVSPSGSSVRQLSLLLLLRDAAVLRYNF